LLATPAPGELERAKIADLGVAKLAALANHHYGPASRDSGLHGARSSLPAPPFDGRADLFSLGVIVYWLATGDKPFGGDTHHSRFVQDRQRRASMPRRLNPAVPLALEKIIMRCLEKDPPRATEWPKRSRLISPQPGPDTSWGRAGAAGLAGILSASGGTMASGTNAGAGMSGDPNTTLDSDVRLQMATAKRRQAPARKPVSARPARQYHGHSCS